MNTYPSKKGRAPTHPDLASGDAIDLVRLVEKTDYAGAVAILRSGNFGTAQPVEHKLAPNQVQDKPHPFDAPKMSRLIAYAQSQLTPASAGGQYLAGRGLQPATWRQFRFGFGYWSAKGIKYDAILIPWHDPDRKLVAVSYRLLNPPEGVRRYYVAGNKIGQMWGTNVQNEPGEAIFVCEGEINAASAWQALGASSASLGSQNARMTPEQGEYIGRWKRIFLWADNPTVAEGWKAVIGRGEIVRSKADANEMLQAGRLRWSGR